ncbi:MAG: hypothetical protein ACO26G_00660 [Rickettsiales bacterium]
MARRTTPPTGPLVFLDGDGNGFRLDSGADIATQKRRPTKSPSFSSYSPPFSSLSLPRAKVGETPTLWQAPGEIYDGLTYLSRTVSNTFSRSASFKRSQSQPTINSNRQEKLSEIEEQDLKKASELYYGNDVNIKPNTEGDNFKNSMRNYCEERYDKNNKLSGDDIINLDRSAIHSYNSYIRSISKYQSPFDINAEHGRMKEKLDRFQNLPGVLSFYQSLGNDTKAEQLKKGDSEEFKEYLRIYLGRISTNGKLHNLLSCAEPTNEHQEFFKELSSYSGFDAESKSSETQPSTPTFINTPTSVLNLSERTSDKDGVTISIQPIITFQPQPKEPKIITKKSIILDSETKVIEKNDKDTGKRIFEFSKDGRRFKINKDEFRSFLDSSDNKFKVENSSNIFNRTKSIFFSNDEKEILKQKYFKKELEMEKIVDDYLVNHIQKFECKENDLILPKGESIEKENIISYLKNEQDSITVKDLGGNLKIKPSKEKLAYFFIQKSINGTPLFSLNHEIEGDEYKLKIGESKITISDKDLKKSIYDTKLEADAHKFLDSIKEDPNIEPTKSESNGNILYKFGEGNEYITIDPSKKSQNGKLEFTYHTQLGEQTYKTDSDDKCKAIIKRIENRDREILPRGFESKNSIGKFARLAIEQRYNRSNDSCLGV